MRPLGGLDFEPQVSELPGHLQDAGPVVSDTVIKTVPSLGRVCLAASWAL